MSTMLVTLLNGVAAAGAGTEAVLATDERYQGGEHTIEVAGTFVATVVFQGRIDANWYTFASLIAPGSVNVPGCFYGVRGNVTAYTSGSITQTVRYPLLQALATSITAVLADTAALLTRLSVARANLLDNLVRLDTTVSALSAVTDINNLIKLLQINNRL